MAQATNRVFAAALAGLSFFAIQPIAFASLNQVAAGASVSQPLGDAAQTLSRPVGVQAEAWVDGPNWVSDHVDLRLSALYQPFSVRNLDNATLNFVGFFGGVQATGGAVGFGLAPFIAAELGGVYSALNFSGAPGATTNASTNFALRVIPGVDFPIFKRLGMVVELPMTVVFESSVLAIWNGSFSLRWKL